MLGFILPFIAICAKDYPQISLLVASDSMNDRIEEILKKQYNTHLEHIQSQCDKISDVEIKDNCKVFKDSFVDVYTSNGNDINKQLQKVHTKTDILYFLTDGISSSIDFKNLKSKMTVIVSIFDIADESENSFSNVLKNMRSKMLSQKKINFFMQSDRSILNDYDEPIATISVSGDMKSKVSHLTICSLTVKFDGDINCQTLFLRGSMFVPRKSNLVERISVDFLIEDDISFELNSNVAFFVKQYTYYSDNTNSQKKITIENKEQYSDLNYLSYGFGLEYRDEIGIILTASSVNIEIEGEKIKKPFVVNITLINDLYDFDLPTFQEQKTVTITTSGVEEFEENEPVFHITYDQNEIKLDKTNFKLNLNEHQMFSYVPKGESSSKNIGMIIGIVVAVVVVIVVVIIVVIIVIRKKKNRDVGSSNEAQGYDNEKDDA